MEQIAKLMESSGQLLLGIAAILAVFYHKNGKD